MPGDREPKPYVDTESAHAPQQMLTQIAIRNLVIVRALELGLGPGMTALTGETGAGKSILVDALGLALGDKADTGMIRAGEERAEITVGFDLSAHPMAIAWLNERDLGGDETECLLRRVLVREGRNRAYINGTPMPQAALREFGEVLIDIHGQHAHQSLLRARSQLHLLDGYAGLQAQVRKTAQAYQAWRDASDAHRDLMQAGEDRANRLDYLRFQIAELDGIACDQETLAGLESEHARLAHAEQLLRDSAAVAEQLAGEDRALLSLLSHAIQTLTALCTLDPTLEEARDLLETAGIQMEEAASVLRHYQDGIELDPERLSQISDHLGRLHDAARKHRTKPGELGRLLAALQEEAALLTHADANLSALDQRAREAETIFRDAARALSESRAKAAAKLSRTVSDSMQELGMQGGRFRVACAVDAERPGPHGLDRVTFLVAANPGQPEAPLAGVASGGELSRISLAIQVATADCGTVPTLIFDEVDVGIGGAVAEIVGQLLRRLGGKRQVLCVTHLPQVAAQAHHHLRVHKLTDGKTTETRIDRLDDGARIDEVARMLGGIDITEQTRRHADEMIRRAQLAS